MEIAKRCSTISPSLTLEITAKANKLKADGMDVISFGAGEPDFNTPQYIIDAAKVALDKGMTKYTPASGTVALRKAVCDKLLKDNKLSYEPAQVVISNGAKHALYNAFLAVVNEGDEVILPAPYWLTYPELIKLCGGKPVELFTKAENDFKVTPDELKKAITPKTKAFVLNNPSNPTGTVYTEAELRALAKVLEGTGVYIVSDDIYEKLTYGVDFFCIAQASEDAYNRTIVVNGVSKSYSMTGWRIGYTASNKPIAKAIADMQSHMTSNPNSIAQYATVVAHTSPEGEKFLAEMKGVFESRLRLITGMLDTMQPLTYICPKGAFYVMVNVSSAFGKSLNGKAIASAYDYANVILESENVAVVPCESFGAPEYVRLSYAISERDIAEGLKRMAAFSKKLV